MVCEILQGVTTDDDARRVLRHLRSFHVLESGGIELAVSAARHSRVVRSRGKTVRKTIDCMIATFCLERGHRLLHSDRDFDPFETILGLEVVHA